MRKTSIPWPEIDVVLLDMDGTLLDLHFDNHFWLEYVPQRYAEKWGLPLEQAKGELLERYRAVEGTMDWYCVDFWTRELDLDIQAMKREIHHLIAVHDHVLDFLDAVRRAGKRVALVTNAHSKSLALKMERTQLQRHFDALICSHDLGAPKEDARFWPRLAATEPFDPLRTLFVDDSLAVLKTADAYGIRHLLGVRWPDSRGPQREVGDYPAIDSFRDLLPIEP